MKIEIIPTIQDEYIPAIDMPMNSVGAVSSVSQPKLYLIHTEGNGDDFIKVWDDSNAIESVAASVVKGNRWKVKLLPEGTKVTLTF